MSNLILINCALNAPLILISIIGNALVLAAILRTPSLRSPSTVYLCSLAVSDLLVGLVVQPVFIAYELKPLPLVSATSMLLLIFLACGVSLCTMTAISVDRLLALHYHMRYPNLVTEKRALYAAATIWFSCVLISFLSLWDKSQAVLAVGILSCLLISTFSYVQIYRIVRRHQLQIHAQQQAVQSFNAEHNLNMVRSRKSAINTFIDYISLILCYSPVFVYMI